MFKKNLIRFKHCFNTFNFAVFNVSKNFSKISKVKSIPKNSRRDTEFKYKIENFRGNSSKYSINKDRSLTDTEQKIPKYLEDYDFKKYKEEKDNEVPKKSGMDSKNLKAGKKMTIIKKPFQKKQTKEERMKKKKDLILLKENPLTKKISKEEKLLLENNQTSIVRYDTKYIEQERQKYKNEMVKMKKDMIARKRIFNPENLPYFSKEERLSKRISKLGIASRRQAEKMIKLGMIKIDGKSVEQNIPVNSESNIQIYSNIGYKTPIPESTRIWLFYKPSGYICTSNDDKKRPNVFKFLEMKKFPIKHYIIIGKLDINSEGLLILTNNSDLAISLEKNELIERSYKVRVYGRMFTEEKLNKIRKGIKINLHTIKLWAEFIHKQNSNTWVHIKAYNNSVIDIRNVFRKLSLRVNRIIRTNYGPYSLNVAKNPGDITEAVISSTVKQYMYHRYKDKTKNILSKLNDTKLENAKLQILEQQKRVKKIESKAAKLNKLY